jgi:cytochrome c oxidase subunit 3
MTTASSTLLASPPPPGDFTHHSQIDLAQHPARLRRYRLGLALYIMSVIMLFVGFSSAYVVRRGIPTYESVSGTYSINWEPLELPLGLLLANTLVLVGASFAMEKARRQTQAIAWKREAGLRFGFEWILLSWLLCVGFVAGQGIAWRSLWTKGHFVTSGARTAFFYLLTATHAFHAVLGVAALTWIAFSYKRWFALKRCTAVDLVAWYLHAMTLLWIYLFVFLWLA